MTHATVAEQFDDAHQQREAVHLGMWTFLLTEVLFFGGLFAAYAVYRLQFYPAFAEAGHHLYMWIGAVNTGVLLLSSFTMALAVHAVHINHPHRATVLLLITMLLGLLFLAIKGVEYYLDYHDGLVPGASFRNHWESDAAHAQLFYVLYFVITGLHALHLLIGVAAVAILAWAGRRGGLGTAWANTVEMTGLYWHFVDIVWIFLFPLLYLWQQ